MASPKRKEKNVESTPAPAESSTTPRGSFEPWRKPAGLTPKGLLVLAVIIFLVNVPILHYRFIRSSPSPTVTLPYTDDFSNASTVERHYSSTGGHWRVVNGELFSPGVKNNPLWLRAALPQNVAVEFDVRSESPEGDIKVEIFGDGMDHASGYVLIHGGWNNSLSIIARLDEHGTPLQRLEQHAQELAKQQGLSSAGLVETGVFKDSTRMRVQANPYPVQIGKTYRWRIERRGGLLRWLIDGQPFMQFEDPLPLEGAGNDRFGFSSWEANLYFDNLEVRAL